MIPCRGSCPQGGSYFALVSLAKPPQGCCLALGLLLSLAVIEVAAAWREKLGEGEARGSDGVRSIGRVGVQAECLLR